jgi:hypothetical protein
MGLLTGLDTGHSSTPPAVIQIVESRASGSPNPTLTAYAKKAETQHMNLRRRILSDAAEHARL